MFFYLLAPVFSRDAKEQDRRGGAINEWFRARWRPFAAKNGWTSKLSVGRTSPEELEKAEQYAELYKVDSPRLPRCALQDKGVFFSNCMQVVLGDLHKEYYRKESSIIFCDGSGKIDFNSIIGIACGLARGDQLILGYRAKPETTQSENRVIIERFENYIISQRFHIVLPDGQCGCWGLSTRMLCKMPVTARSYDLELDILIGGLYAGMEPRFSEVKLIGKPRGSKKPITDYTEEIHEKKLVFILHKLNIPGTVLPAMAGEFQKATGLRLPKEYLRTLEKLNKISNPYPLLVPQLYKD